MIIVGMVPRKVSIVMPVYASKDTLSRAVNSVLSQDYDGPIELLCLYDDAHDGTREVLTSLLSTDPKRGVTLIERDTPMGVGGARRVAMEYFDGEYFGSLDADDELLPGAIQTLVSALEEHKADAVNASFLIIDGAKRKQDFFRKDKVYDTKGALSALFNDASMRSFLWCKLFRTKLIRGVSAIPHSKRAIFEDLPYCVSLLSRSEKVVSIKTPVVGYHIDIPTSETAKPRQDRAMQHLVAFALSRKLLEEDLSLLKAFFAHRLRSYFSLLYDLGKDKKAGADKTYVKQCKTLFKSIYKKDAFSIEGTPLEPYTQDAFISF